MSRGRGEPWRGYGRAVAFAIVATYATGAAGHAVPALRPFMLAMTPGFLLLTGTLVLLPSLAAGRSPFALWAFATYAGTFVAEAAGVATGAIFGEYEYGPTLGLAWFGVPLIIAFNWVLAVHGAIVLAGRIGRRLKGFRGRYAQILLTGLLAVLFDFIMEPVAIRLDYWRWPGNVVPIQNYAAWFVIAAAAAGFHPGLRPAAPAARCAGCLAGLYLAVQTAFFALQQMIWHLGAP